MFRLWHRKTSSERWVRACITNVGFPQKVEGLREMLRTRVEMEDRPITDLESLLEFRQGTEGDWTAPRYMLAGDILFFYHAASAKARIAALQRQVGDSDDMLAGALARSKILADRFAGTIFGCAEIVGSVVYDRPASVGAHYKSRSFAPFREVTFFKKHPLAANEFPSTITIKRGVALTPVEGQSFDALKAKLAEHNRLPPFLVAARPGGIDFAGVNATTWRVIACADDKRFSDESQVRAYLIDYLLDEIKDPDTSCLVECPCFRSGTTKRTGVADYLISIDGRWIPVEAKLNIYAERDILSQVQQYTHIDSFQWPGRQRQNVPRQPYCLVIDQAGLYLCADGFFVAANGRLSSTVPDEPLIARANLGRRSGTEVGALLRSLLSTGQ